MHLAAKYALRQLCDKLLDLPDSSHACLLGNINRQRPSQLAAISGHNDLASRLTVQNVSNLSELAARA